MRALCLAVLSLSFVSLRAQTGSTSGPAELARASDLLNHGHPAQAIAILQKLAAVAPPIAGAEHELGTAYYGIGDLPKAKDAFAKAIEQDKSDQDSVQMEGLTLYRLGRPDAAIPYLERVVQANPNANVDAQTILGLCFIRLDDFDNARSTYATLFGQPPDSAAAFLLLATILRQMDLPAPAEVQVKKALDIAPNLPMAHFMLGEFAAQKSDYGQAARQFEDERRFNPDFAPAYASLGDAYMHLGKLPEAQMALTKAITLNANLTSAFAKLGAVLLRRQDIQTAIMYLEHAEKLDPGDFETHVVLAQAYKRVGREDDARRENAIADKSHH
jgi:tetratricopeptide (TPR) repeat protein